MKMNKILKRFLISFFSVCLITCGLWGWGFWQAQATLKYYVNVFKNYGCQVAYTTFVNGFPFHINLHVPTLSIKGDGESILQLLDHLTGSSLLTDGLRKIVDNKTHIVLEAKDIKTNAFVFKPFDHKSSANVELFIYQDSKELLSFDLGKIHIDYQNLEATTISPNHLSFKNVKFKLPGTQNIVLKIGSFDYRQNRSKWNMRYKLNRKIKIKDIHFKAGSKKHPALKSLDIDSIHIHHTVTSLAPSWSDLFKICIQEVILYKDLLKERCTIFSRTMPPLSPLLEKLENNKVLSQGSIDIDFKGAFLGLNHTAEVLQGEPNATFTLKLKEPQKALNYAVKSGILSEKYAMSLLTFFELGMEKSDETYQTALSIKNGGVYKDENKFFEYSKNIWKHIPLIDPVCEYIDGKPVNVSADYLMEEYEKLQSLDRSGSQFDLGLAYFKEGRLTEAFSWYQKAAKQKNPYALYMIGFMYYSGKGREHDKEKAKDYIVEAIKCNLDLSHMRPIMESADYLKFAKQVAASLKH